MRSGSPKNIVMIADDDLFIRQIIKKILSDLCVYKEAGDGEDILPLYKKTMPDMVFLDIHLPGITGLELIPQIREVDNEAHIIMITSDSTEDNVRFAKQHGANGFIAKPFNGATLLKLFHRCPTISFVD